MLILPLLKKSKIGQNNPENRRTLSFERGLIIRMAWNILETKAASAEANMLLDAKLLENLEGRPILHLYEWEKPSATFGYFIKPEELMDLEEVKKKGLDLARRPTGGGVVFHLWDLAFSVLVPAKSKLFSTNTLDNYNLVNQVVKGVVKEFIGEEIELIPEDVPFQDQICTRFCMARPTKYDVMLQGKKIAGAAQRRTKDGFLHQGTIALLRPDPELLEAVLPVKAVREAMVQTTFALFSDPKELKEGRRELCEQLKSEFIKL
jgi:lipoate-protein ligase A